MIAETKAGRYLARGFILFAAWTVFGVLSSAHFFFGYNKDSGLSEFLYLADNVIVFYWGWALLTPVVLAVARRLSQSGMRRVQDWVLLMAAAFGIMILHGVIHTSVVDLAGIDRHPERYSLVDYLQRHGGGDIATFAVLVGGYLLYDANRRARAKEVAASKLSAQLARADLELLRWNLHPHFLFNALNTVSTLVMKGDNDNAGIAIEKISRFLRSGLSQRADSLVTVAQDVGVVKRYVEIEGLRFGDALQIDVMLEDGASDATIPGSLLQPLVENAITHGTARQTGSRPIRIHGTTNGDRLLLSVTNDGTAHETPSMDETIHESVDSARFGLRYVRERLKQFYGDDARFTLESAGGETVALIDVPLIPPSAAEA